MPGVAASRVLFRRRPPNIQWWKQMDSKPAAFKATSMKGILQNKDLRGFSIVTDTFRSAQ
eukprot:640923-Amphidinium_carterae.1